MAVYAVLLCAGSSQRMGFDKLFTPLGGKTAALRSAELLYEAGAELAVITVNDTNREKAEETPWPFPVIYVRGGKERQDSVLQALEALPAGNDDVVMIHDAARCFMPSGCMAASVKDARMTGSGVCALPMKDSVFSVKQGRTESLDRSSLFRTQTPQTFLLRDILSAYRACTGACTDDADVYVRMFGRVTFTPGSERGRKLTGPEDWEWAKLLTEPGRYGTGFDTHVLTEGRPLILGGVHVPFEKGLLGHSDADVLLHAITDALLGAAALGDIGSHFPDKDPRYKGIDSRVLLREAVRLVREAGFAPCNIDATVICELPKLNPHFPAMRANIAADTGLPLSAVSLKATTTEKMNDEGRGLCISAQAVASVRAAAPDRV